MGMRVFSEFLLFVVGFTLPFEYAHVDFLGMAWTPSKVTAALLLAISAVRFLLERRTPRRDPKAIWVALMALSIFVSSIHGYFVGVPLPNLVTMTISWLSLITFYFLMVFLLRGEREVKVVLAGLVAGALIVTLTGFLGLGELSYSQEGERIVGQSGGPNNLAFNLVLSLPVVLAYLYSSQRRGARIMWGACAVFMLLGIGATLSRAGLLAIPAMGLLWAVRLRLGNVVRYAFPVVCLVVAVALFLPDTVAERAATLSPVGARQDDSIQSRVTTGKLALQAFAESPVLGIGLLRFVSYAVDHGAAHVNVIHNAYLDVATEQGLIGFIPYLAITLLAWRHFSEAIRLARGQRRSDPRAFWFEIRAVMLQISLLGVLVISQFQPTGRYKGLWLLFALSTVLPRLVRERIVKASSGPDLASSRRAGAPFAH